MAMSSSLGIARVASGFGGRYSILLGGKAKGRFVASVLGGHGPESRGAVCGSMRGIGWKGRFKSTRPSRLSPQSSPSYREMLETLRESMGAALLKPRTIPVPRWVTPRHFSLTLSECFGHASFILVACSYAYDDFFMLRIIAVAGSTSMLFFTYFHPHGKVLWLPFRWNCLFIAINSFWIARILYQRSMARHLSDDLVRIRNDHFYILDPVDFAMLIAAGKQETYQSGDLILGQGSMNRFVRLVLEGECEVLRDGKCTYNLEEGNFASECGLHAGLMLHGDVEACASVIAKRYKDGRRNKVRLIRWDRTELMQLLRQQKSLARSLKAALSWDIVRKLKSQRQMILSGDVDDPETWTILRNKQNDDRYAAILQNMLKHPDSISKDQLNKYRSIHHIDDQHHQLALDQCGWTLHEYELGKKLHSNTDKDDDDDDDDYEENDKP